MTHHELTLSKLKQWALHFISWKCKYNYYKVKYRTKTDDQHIKLIVLVNINEIKHLQI